MVEAVMEQAETQTPTHKEEIRRKMHFKGRVVKITTAGAIVDIGINKPAVVHISQLSRNPVRRVEDVVQVGQEVDVWVRRITPKGIIELTMIEPYKWEWRELKPGLVVSGKVVRILDRGIEVDIGAPALAFVPIAEMSHAYVRHPSEMVKEGDEIEAKVIEVNRRRRRIRLSMKALEPEAPVTKDDGGDEEMYVPSPMELALMKAIEEAQQKVAESAGQAREDALKRLQELERLLANLRGNRASGLN